MPEAKVPLRNVNIPMTPLATFIKPKSDIPNAFKMTREVNKPMNIIRSILKYNIRVFFAIRVLFSEYELI